MEISQLNTFRVVARTLHFTRASEELNLTQSAVSHQIRALEDELGVKLFVRNKRKISLTPHGQKVLDYANKMLQQLEDMRYEIEDNRETLKGELKLVAITRSLDNPFPQVRRSFKESYADIKLSFQTVLDTEIMLQKVRRGEADIGFSAIDVLNLYDYEGLLTVPWGEFEMMFVVGKNHHLASKKEFDLPELKDEEWILFERGSWARSTIDNCFDDHNFEPDNVYETNDGVVIRSMVKNGEGISILPSWGISDDLGSGNLISIKPKNVNMDVPLNIIISSAQRSKLVSAFIDFLLEIEIKGLRVNKKE